MFTGAGGAVGWFPDTAHLIDEGGEGTDSYVLNYQRPSFYVTAYVDTVLTLNGGA
jgi:hypothetical protein